MTNASGMLRAVRWLWLLLLGLELACAPPCTTSNCSGCCQNGVCYEGGGCFGTLPVGGGGAGGGTARDAGAEPCRTTYQSCNPGVCCATGSNGDPITCRNFTCEPACATSGRCSTNSQCCKEAGSSYGYFCRLSSNSCTICSNRGTRCSRGVPDDCCPGLTCGSQAATPNYFECL